MNNSEVVVNVGRNIELCYDQTGDPDDPAVVLIAGLGQQLHSWPDDFVGALAGRGYHVTRFDNRDAGRSTHMKYRPPNPVAMFRGGDPRHQYHLGDMARDTVGLMDALGCADAHLVGISMGGMIAQTVAAHHPGRVRTLTSIMSTTGARRLGRPAPSTWRRMLTSRPPRTRAEAMDRAANMFSHIGSHGFPFDRQAVRTNAGIAWDRDPSPAGIVRQLTGIFASGDRTAELAQIDVPTLVIHGDRDRMVHPTGGAATARAIPGARLETIVGLGHDLPIGAWDRIIDLITAHTTFAPVTHTRNEENA
jgi:pimeloyl-ACP methyl ester carboxylesterase